MIETIVGYINDEITNNLSYFNNEFGLCEIIERQTADDEEQQFPAEYEGNGEYTHVAEVDHKNGTLYHRLRSEVDFEEGNDHTDGSQTDVEVTWPVRTVFFVKRDVLSDDDNYIDHEIAMNIMQVVTQIQDTSLVKDLNAHLVEVYPVQYDTDRYSVHEKETQNVEMLADYNYIYGLVDFDILVSLDQKCLTLNT